MTEQPTPVETTVADIVAGRHADDSFVTVTGFFNGGEFHTTKQGDPWMVAYLVDSSTAVRVRLLPQEYKAFEGILAPTKDEYRPAEVRITGRVSSREFQPAITVAEVARLSSEPAHGLEHFRRTQARGKLLALKLAAEAASGSVALDSAVAVEYVLSSLAEIGKALLPIVADNSPLQRRIKAIADAQESERLYDDMLMIQFALEFLAGRGVVPS